MLRSLRSALLATACLLLPGCATVAPPPTFDLIVRDGTIYDGSGGAPYVGDVAIKGDRIVSVGGDIAGSARTEIDARGLAVAPGFINMLSWANESLIEDGRGQSDIRQGVTLEVMGEGSSMGPLNPEMKRQLAERQNDIKYPVTWTSFAEYFQFLERKGVSPNVASFVGAGTVRTHELGEGEVAPTPEQLARMRLLVRQAMNEGAMGVGSSLIYAPDSFAKTDELVALATESARCGGMYISHMRSEGDRLLEAVDELIEIARRSGGPAEIYHLKMAGGRIGASCRRSCSASKRLAPPACASPPTCTPTPPAPRARRGDAALGPGWRPRTLDRAARRSRRASPRRGRDEAAGQGLGKPLSWRRPREDDPGRLQERSAEATYRQDAGGRGETLGEEP
jgi:hypothetical protein